VRVGKIHARRTLIGVGSRRDGAAEHRRHRSGHSDRTQLRHRGNNSSQKTWRSTAAALPSAKDDHNGARIDTESRKLPLSASLPASFGAVHQKPASRSEVLYFIDARALDWLTTEPWPVGFSRTMRWRPSRAPYQGCRRGSAGWPPAARSHRLVRMKGEKASSETLTGRAGSVKSTRASGNSPVEGGRGEARKARALFEPSPLSLQRAADARFEHAGEGFDCRPAPRWRGMRRPARCLCRDG